MILLEDNRKALYQWDLNQRLILIDIEAGTEVQISDSNNTDEHCLTTKAYNENGTVYAKIPNIYLQKSGILYVYIYVHQDDKSYTKYYTEVIVLPRKKPSNYVYTETEKYTVSEMLKDALEEAKASGEFKGDKGDKGDPFTYDDFTPEQLEALKPVKGTDYFTDSEVKQIQNEISSGAIGDFKAVVDSETNKYNTNATEKLNAYNSNAETKTAAYNQNADNRVAEFKSDFEIARQNAVKEIKAAENAALENIGTGIDDTLTQSGKAADAKETGDKLSKLKSDLDKLNPLITQAKNVFDDTWNIGTYYDSVNTSVNTRRYLVVPCKLGDEFTLEFSDETWFFWVYFADSSGVINYKQITPSSANKTINIVETDGRTPTEIRFNCYHQPDQDLSGANWELFDVACIITTEGRINILEKEYEEINKRVSDLESKSLLKVATMNVGLWYDGITEGVPNDDVFSVSGKWRRMLGNHDADLICLQEWRNYFDRDKTIESLPYIFDFKYKNRYSTENQLGKGLVSKYPFEIPTLKAFDSGVANRGYVKTYITINEKRICIINAHTSIESDFSVNRESEFNELKTLMLGEEYAICFGDMNAYTTDEFDVFTNVGLNVANHGLFGNFDTWSNFDKTSTWTNKALDNIITTSNISIQNVICDRQDLSDHNMLIAELSIN